MSRVVAIVAASALLAGCAGDGDTSSAGPTSGTEVPGRLAMVERVIDGDTIVVRASPSSEDTEPERVRLIGIDTPESVQPGSPVECFALEASHRMERLLAPGTRVRLVGDVESEDRYGRTLAYVYRDDDGLFVNAAMVRDGYAYAYTVPPNVAHAAEFARLQGEAQAANRGLWASCPPA